MSVQAYASMQRPGVHTDGTRPGWGMPDLCQTVDNVLQAHHSAARVMGGYGNRRAGVLVLTLTYRYELDAAELAHLQRLMGDGVTVASCRGAVIIVAKGE